MAGEAMAVVTALATAVSEAMGTGWDTAVSEATAASPDVVLVEAFMVTAAAMD
jgi:hypothetical protein